MASPANCTKGTATLTKIHRDVVEHLVRGLLRSRANEEGATLMVSVLMLGKDGTPVVEGPLQWDLKGRNTEKIKSLDISSMPVALSLRALLNGERVSVADLNGGGKVW